MISKPDDLPSDLVSALAALQAEREARLRAEAVAANWPAQAANAQAQLSDTAALIAHLELRIETLKRELYGQRSERTARLLEQLELEELVTTASEDELAAQAAAAKTQNVRPFMRKRPVRKPWPDDIERERVMLSALAEEIAFVGRDEVGMQDSLHASFNPDDLRPDASALGHLAPEAVGVLVSNPDLRQEAGSMQLCQGPSIDLVRFDSRIGGRPTEPRIGDRDALNVRAQKTFDRRAVASHLDDHLILEAECLGEGDEPIADELYAELSDYCSVLQDRHLGERSVDVHANDLHAWFSFISGASGLHDIYRSALAAQPGKSWGAAK